MHMALEMQKVKPSAIICHACNNFTSESIIMLCSACLISPLQSVFTCWYTLDSYLQFLKETVCICKL